MSLFVIQVAFDFFKLSFEFLASVSLSCLLLSVASLQRWLDELIAVPVFLIIAIIAIIYWLELFFAIFIGDFQILAIKCN